MAGYGCGRKGHLGRGVTCGSGWRLKRCVQDCTCRFSWRMNERNNYELGGANWEYSFAPPKIAALGGSLHLLRPFLAAEARFVSGLRCKTGWRRAEGFLDKRLGVGREQPQFFCRLGQRSEAIRTDVPTCGHGISLYRHVGGRFCSAVGQLLPPSRVLVLRLRDCAQGERSANGGSEAARTVRHRHIARVASPTQGGRVSRTSTTSAISGGS